MNDVPQSPKWLLLACGIANRFAAVTEMVTSRPRGREIGLPQSPKW